MLNEKGGWIRVVEAFIAVLIVAGVIIIAVTQNGPDTGISSGVYEDQLEMLYAIQYNDTLRDSIMEIGESSLPLSLEDSEFPQDVKTKLEEKNPGYLICDAKLCLIDKECLIENTNSSDVYVSQATLFASIHEYSPRKLVLSCVLS